MKLSVENGMVFIEEVSTEEGACQDKKEEMEKKGGREAREES